jgi:hypothetical protein
MVIKNENGSTPVAGRGQGRPWQLPDTGRMAATTSQLWPPTQCAIRSGVSGASTVPNAWPVGVVSERNPSPALADGERGAGGTRYECRRAATDRAATIEIAVLPSTPFAASR